MFKKNNANMLGNDTSIKYDQVGAIYEGALECSLGGLAL